MPPLLALLDPRPALLSALSLGALSYSKTMSVRDSVFLGGAFSWAVSLALGRAALLPSLLGCLSGFLAGLCLKLFSRAAFKKDGFGEADVLALGLLGFHQGSLWVFSLFAASAFGLLWVLALRLRGRRVCGRIPFFPFLAAGAAAAEALSLLL